MFCVRFLLIALAGASLAMPAEAAFQFCNNTRYPIEAAFGYREETAWMSEGWWQIQPGQCARVYNKPLTQRFYFYYGRQLLSSNEGKPPVVWSGKYAFCADKKAFRSEGDSNCESRGLEQRGFQEVDVGLNQRDYSLSFEDGSGLK